VGQFYERPRDLLAQLRLIIALYVVLGDHDEQADGSKNPLHGTWLGMIYTTMCGYTTTKCMTTAVSFIRKNLLTSLQLPALHTDNEGTSVKEPQITCIKCQHFVRTLVGSTATVHLKSTFSHRSGQVANRM